MLTINPVKRI